MKPFSITSHLVLLQMRSVSKKVKRWWFSAKTNLTSEYQKSSNTCKTICLSLFCNNRWRVRTRRSKNFIKVEEGFAPSAYLKATNETVDVDAPDVTQETPKDEQAIAKDNKKKKE